MPFDQVLLDTDILSAIMRKNPAVIPKARSYLAVHKQLTISMITRYEILRGLKAKDATVQLRHFETFCEKNLILPLTDEIIVRASEIYAELRRKGELVGDADILIAASAMIHGLGVVTNNETHFKRISELRVENWLRDDA